MNFFDTNVLIAASVTHHPHHAACHKRLAELRRTGGACAAHTLAETYSNLTRQGRSYGLPPLTVLTLLEGVSKTFSLVTLTAAETMRALQAAARQDIRGPLLYDALLIACARKVEARLIYTNDLADFQRAAPDLAARIRLP